MCLGIPMKVEEINGEFAIVSIGDIRKKVNISLIDDLKVDDYLIVHAGFAIEKIDRKQAEETLEILKEIK